MKKVVDYIDNFEGKIILHTCSIYNTFLAVYILMQSKRQDDTYVIMSSPYKSDVEAFNEISGQLSLYNIRSIVIDKKNPIYRAIGISDYRNKRVMKKVYQDLEINNGNFLLVNCSWTNRKVGYPASLYLKKARESIFLQEGKCQYVTPNDKWWYLALKKLYGNQTTFWKMDKLKKIYVQDPSKFPKYLQNIMEPIAINFDNKKLSNIMLDIFLNMSDQKDIENLRSSDGIIFSQPISEDGYVTEDEKKRIYEEIVSYYKSYGRVVFKRHPRDLSEYSFEDVSIIKSRFPSEILGIMGIKFDFAVGLCTGAIDSVIAKSRVNLNENFLSELTFELIKIDDGVNPCEK